MTKQMVMLNEIRAKAIKYNELNLFWETYSKLSLNKKKQYIFFVLKRHFPSKLYKHYKGFKRNFKNKQKGFSC